jgi:hypothetical protein
VSPLKLLSSDDMGLVCFQFAPEHPMIENIDALGTILIPRLRGSQTTATTTNTNLRLCRFNLQLAIQILDSPVERWSDVASTPGADIMIIRGMLTAHSLSREVIQFIRDPCMSNENSDDDVECSIHRKEAHYVSLFMRILLDS